MRRRDFTTSLVLLSGAAVGSARAQSLPVAGFLFSEGEAAASFRTRSFRDGLKETGFVEGQTVAVEYRWANGQRDRLAALAADLVARRAAVICAGNINAALAARPVIGATPLVFLTASDPVADGLVESFNRPGGTATGVRIFSSGLIPKRLQLLRELLPEARAIGFLANPGNPTAPAQLAGAREAAAAIGLAIVEAQARDAAGLDAAFDALARQKADAVVVGADPFFNNSGAQVIALAARHRLPAIYEWRESTAAGGLMSYGTDLPEAFRLLGVYCGRILKGAKPADLPVLQPTRFEFVINLRTAAALGLKVPPLLQAQADELIE